VAEAETLEEVREALLASSARLRELDLFNGVDMLIDTSAEARGPDTCVELAAAEPFPRAAPARRTWW
jgi:hypothetical protein